jgi:glutamate racemase|tara:strand:- start:1385 stop:2218 length:834 start_codon:yes stop_codon:yes gene_type:complete
MPDQQLPIGVFDSGMGGLTVLSALAKAMPNEQFIYLGDSARLPYGTKSPDTVVRYARQASKELVRRGVKALVVACNTASASALKILAEDFAPLPVFGVVEPGAQAAAAQADASGVLVLATESTILGGAYQRALLQQNPSLTVFGRACPLWVTLAEQGWVGDQAASLTQHTLEHGLRGFVPSMQATVQPKTVLLGCTHFPVFRQQIEALVGADVQVVDSAQTTAATVSDDLSKLGLLRDKPAADSEMVFLATDGVERFRKVGGYFFGGPLSNVSLVDL